jgi:hypothetical protein
MVEMQQMERVELCELARRFVDGAARTEDLQEDVKAATKVNDEVRIELVSWLKLRERQRVVLGLLGRFWLIERRTSACGPFALDMLPIEVFTEPGLIVDPLPIGQAGRVPVSRMVREESPEPAPRPRPDLRTRADVAGLPPAAADPGPASVEASPRTVRGPAAQDAEARPGPDEQRRAMLGRGWSSTRIMDRQDAETLIDLSWGFGDRSEPRVLINVEARRHIEANTNVPIPTGMREEWTDHERACWATVLREIADALESE